MAPAALLAEFAALRKALRSGAAVAGFRCESREPLRSTPGEFGISRVGELTGLDIIGLPVWFACRPQSRALSIAMGKGLDPDQAWISAVLESVESAVAERHEDMIALTAAPEEMAARGKRCADLDRMARCSGFLVDAARPLAWVEGVDWSDGEPIFCPYELAGMDMSSGSRWDHSRFRMSSTGLGAGFTVADAMLHALLELIEADAAVVADSPLAFVMTGRRLQFQPSACHPLQDALQTLDESGFAVELRALASDIRLPVVQAIVSETPRCRVSTGMAPANGTCCRIDVWEAALGAVLEAVQIRAAYVSGAREDLRYGGGTPAERSNVTGDAGAITVPPPAGPQGTGVQLRRTLQALETAGIGGIHVFPLGCSRAGVRVVRVLAADLESADLPAGKGLGRRAVRRILEEVRGP